MTAAAVAAREGVRLARSSPARTVVVAAIVAAACAVGMVVAAAAIPCAVLAVAVLVVARRSPRPERQESAVAWARAGAGRPTIWAVSVFEALVVGWGATLAGAVVGLLVLTATDTSPAGRPWGYAGAQLALVAIAACAPTGRVELGRGQPIVRYTVRATGALVRVTFVAVALWAMYESALRVTTDWELGIVGAIVVALLAVVGLIVTGPATYWLVRALGHARTLGPAASIASRRRTPGTVRLVVAGALTVATAAAILGASVEARPDVVRVLDERLARMPVLPSNVALVRLDASDLLEALSPSFAETELTPDVRAALARAVPGAELIDVRYVEGDGLLACASSTFCPRGPLIVADDRLTAVYHQAARYRVERGLTADRDVDVLFAHARSRVAPRDVLEQAVHDGRPLPTRYSFTGAQYVEVPGAVVAQVRASTKVRAVFLRSTRPLTRADQVRLAAAVRFVQTAPRTQLVLVGPRGQVVPRPEPERPPRTLREAPWAATSPAQRWLVALVASAVALLALFAALVIDTIDRRRDLERLERIGATPAQLRGGAALEAGVLFTVAAWLDVLVVAWLVHAGTRAFNRSEPTLTVPFTMPWAVVAVLAIGLPVLAALVAALIARPVPRSRE